MASRGGPPIFLPPDPRTEEPYRLTPRLAFRIGVVGVAAIVLFAILFFRLWALQVISGDDYLADARNNQIRTFREDAPRGAILDRNGDVLVTNTPGTVLKFWPNSISKEQRDDVIQRLSVLLDLREKDIRRRVDAIGTDLLTPVTIKTAVRDAKVAYINEHLTDFPGVFVDDTELRRYPEGTLAAHLLGYVGEVSEAELKGLDPKEYRGGDEIGKSGVEFSFDRYLRGVPAIGQVRVDAFGRAQSAPTIIQEAEPGNSVRLTLDADLQRAAEAALENGVRRAASGLVRPSDQENVSWAAGGGAVVVMQANTGAILAMATYPTYNPGVFVGRVSQDRLDEAGLGDPDVQAELNYPSINRAMQALYPPGSVFKPVTALAAMNELSRTGERPILRPGDINQCVPKREFDNQVFRNWDPEMNRPMTLREALAASCDTIFYDIGYQFYSLPGGRGSPLQEWARRLGFGEFSGIDVGPESDGLLPTPEWKRKTSILPKGAFRGWSSGDSVQLAIGQGYMLATPLQVTRLYAMLANGGELPTPYMVEQVEKSVGSAEQPVVLRRFAPAPAQDIGLTPESVQAVRIGLFDATHDANGTGYRVFSRFPVPVAGKTGTAEKFVSLPKGYLSITNKPVAQNFDQAWWCGYAPAVDATVSKQVLAEISRGREPIAICAFVENGGFGGESAAPIAYDVLSAYFGLDLSSEDIQIGTAGSSD
ncbi:MAG: penicillin-binding protein 2 [Thermoleophilia bacterium]